jgi:putative endonuclease
MAAKDELGVRGERIAERHLVRRGLTVLDRNWRCPQGEIDLVLRDGDEVVFVEVKTRSSVAFGHPLEAITAAKLARLRRLAGAWCEAHPHGAGQGMRRIRIDAVAVIAPRDLPAIVEHLERVF